ncbi:hypothetical protein SRABI118_04365 [Massilia sp. Bi118]|uniref:cupredoxin domain-containing protein n=1 Tax=Massilia sp. Bi118 TaxID=2822346 RepID=UPI001D999951|nr:hypothetical protein [Massilia sp. Bi118]CAH0300019.1 hypothetical protein SRABI118_04365 [Massilia sp. Bi118]
MKRLRLRLLWCLPAACVAGLLAWAAFAPLAAGSRDALFEIPQGTWARRMAGDLVDILPQQIVLTLGVDDTLLLRNKDSVPQVFGPVLIMPGQDFRLPFDTVSVNEFNCTAHASGSMKVIVEPYPAPGLPRLQWRLAQLAKKLRKAHG